MDLLQTWIVVGVPGLLLAGCLFVGRSNVRSIAGYLVLVATTAAFAAIPGDPLSAAAVGAVIVVLVANGRGQTDDDHIEHHEHRERFTVAEH